MRKRIGLALMLVTALSVGCTSSEDLPGGGGGGGGGTTPTGTLLLASADRPGVSPCSAQAILQDDTDLTALTDALLAGTFIHLDVPFNAADLDIFKKKCGLQGFWDPAEAVNEVAPFTIA